MSSRSSLMSMKWTSLPDKPVVRHRSLTNPREKTTLPAPMMVTLTLLMKASSLR